MQPRSQTALAFACLGLLVASTLPAEARSAVVHRVSAGESLGQIAPRYGCSVREVMAANPALTSPDRIQIGQRLSIPRCVQGGPATDCHWRAEHIDSKTLGKKMRRAGFKPPQKFRALVVKTTLSRDGSRIEGHELWDWRGKGATPAG